MTGWKHAKTKSCSCSSRLHRTRSGRTLTDTSAIRTVGRRDRRPAAAGRGGRQPAAGARSPPYTVVLEAQQRLMRERPPHTHGRASGPSREQGFPHVSSGANALFLFKLAAAGGRRRRKRHHRGAAPYSIGLALVYYSRCCIYTELARAM